MADKNTNGNNLNPIAKASKKTILRHHHAFMITWTNTLNQLLFKCLPAFIAYIMVDYNFSYGFTVTALSIGNLATAAAFLLNSWFLHLPSNIVYCIFCALQSLSCFIFWYFRHSKSAFIIAVIINALTEVVSYGCSNAVIISFTADPNITHKYLAALNGAWTIATFLFFGVGYLMKIGSMWLFLEIMFVLFVMTGILNLCLLPNVSANKYNLLMSESSLKKISIRNDLSVLAKVKAFWIIIIVLVLTFMAWGYFYASFGLWLKGLFSLDQAQFGFLAGLTEGFGNLLGILTVTYLSKSGKDNSKHWYKISLQSMMLWTGLIVMAAMSVICICNFTEWYNEYFLFVMVGAYFYGQETCVCAALILIVFIVPPLQQARASSFIGIVQSCTLFFAQSTVALIYTNFDGMRWESFMLIVLYLLAILDMIYLHKLMKQTQYIDDELLPINIKGDGNKNSLQKYT